jgi:hypothetical protein
MLATLRAVMMIACVGLSGCVYYLNPLCTDQIRNGEETDVDCGGACGRCELGDTCRTNEDCEDSECVAGTCTPLPCVNGVLDPGETDVDCGGPTCRKCSGGRSCGVAGDCFNGTCVAASLTCSSLTTVSFADAVAYPSGFKTYALFSGDLDNDGDVDLAAANETDSTISVLANGGAGAFQLLATPFPTGDYPTGGTLADFNRDGFADVVTADYHGDSVSVLLNTGDGTLAPKATYPTVDGAETSNLAVGDLDNDGNLDVIATNPMASSVSEFLGRADGTLAPPIDVPVGITGGSVPYSAAIGDFDGNGDNDVAIADEVSGTIIVRLGNGDGTLQAEVAYPVGGARSYILITRDVNLDDKLDLICANRGSSNVSVLIGRGDGTFRRAIVSPTGDNTGPYSVAVADFNLDSVPDVITANFGNFVRSTGSASVLLGIGDGSFDPPIDTGPTGVLSYGVAVGDFNGDGKPDFATANASSNDVTVKLNTSQ